MQQRYSTWESSIEGCLRFGATLGFGGTVGFCSYRWWVVKSDAMSGKLSPVTGGDWAKHPCFLRIRHAILMLPSVKTWPFSSNCIDLRLRPPASAKNLRKMLSPAPLMVAMEAQLVVLLQGMRQHPELDIHPVNCINVSLGALPQLAAGCFSVIVITRMIGIVNSKANRWCGKAIGFSNMEMFDVQLSVFLLPGVLWPIWKKHYIKWKTWKFTLWVVPLPSSNTDLNIGKECTVSTLRGGGGGWCPCKFVLGCSLSFKKATRDLNGRLAHVFKSRIGMKSLMMMNAVVVVDDDDDDDDDDDWLSSKLNKNQWIITGLSFPPQ